MKVVNLDNDSIMEYCLETSRWHRKENQAICGLIDDYSKVWQHPMSDMNSGFIMEEIKRITTSILDKEEDKEIEEIIEYISKREKL